MSERLKVAVIGAGMSGLACAYELTKEGHDVVVYEKEEGVGGRAGTRNNGGFPFDIGAQFLNNGYSQVRKYCEELGIVSQWKSLTPSTHHLYHGGRLHCVSFKSVRQFFNLSFYSLWARARLLLCYLKLKRQSKGIDLYDLSTVNDELDSISARDFILKWGGPQVLDYGFDSMIATYHFHGAEDLSLGCLLGAVSAIGTGFSYDYLIDGIDTLAKEMAKKVKLRTSIPIYSVERHSEGVVVRGAHGRNVFDKVVIATTVSTAKQILSSPSIAQRDFLNSVRFAATINASFMVPSVPTAHLAMVAVPFSQNGNVSCYLNQSCKYPDRFEDGQTLINVFLRDERAVEFLDAPDDELWAYMTKEFIKVCPPLAPYVDQVRPHDLQRWPEAIPKYSVGFVSSAAKFWDNGQGDNAIFLCGDYLNAPWMEGSVRCGKKVAGLVGQEEN